MAFLTIRQVATAAVKCANQNIGSGMRGGFKLTSMELRIGSTARYSSVVASQEHAELQSQVLLRPANVSQHHVHMASAGGFIIQELSRTLQLYSKHQRKLETDPKSLQLKSGFDKPTVLIISWLNAKQKHLSKYAKLYSDQGFDIVVAQITPWQLLWPMKGSQLVAADIVKFLKNNEFKNGLIIHGFSVAGYLWGECLVHIARNLTEYQVVLDRVKAQIWDSAADITEIQEGVPRALFPNNPTLQNALRKYMIYHMKAFHEPATSHYIRSSQMFHTNLLRCPALFLVSKTDPVGTEVANGRVRDSWESNGVKCTFKCWDRSPHVGHFRKHPAEYTEQIYAHLRETALFGQQLALRAKL